jgi:uncharacterized membrane protein YphA (DoxX/SURF4 family)
MASVSRRVLVVSWILSALPALLFFFSAFLKLRGGPEVEQGFAHLGLPPRMLMPLAILELSCVILYLVPATAVLGAILLAGYLGGAICTHWRAGDPFVTQIVMGLVLWLGLYLREPRLRTLLPLRRATASAS